MKQTKKNFIVINVLSFFMCLGFFNNSFSNEEPLKNSIKNNQRLQEHIIRDKYRNPEETLNFFGIKPEMHVLEILPGKGYYTEILAHYLNKKGKLTIANFGEDNKNEYLRSLHINFVNYFKKQDFGKMHIRKFYSEGYLSEIPDNSIDLVLTFRNTHNWINNKSVTAIYKSINRVLKKGGTLGVVQHRANINDDEILSSKKGYVPEK